MTLEEQLTEIDGLMADRSIDLTELLGDVKGTDEQLAYLESIVRGLIEVQGEEWIKEHRDRLLEEWDYILELGV